jgi:hypothetical protein
MERIKQHERIRCDLAPVILEQLMELPPSMALICSS